MVIAAFIMGCSSADAPTQPRPDPGSPAPPTVDVSSTVDAMVSERLSAAERAASLATASVDRATSLPVTQTNPSEDPTPISGEAEATLTPGETITPTPTNTPRPTPTPVFLDSYNRGLEHLENEEFSLAISEFTAAIAIDSSVADAYEMRGSAYSKSSDWRLAVDDYAEAIKLEPDNANLYRYRADNLVELGLDHLAIDDYQFATNLNPGVEGGFRGMAQVYALNEDAFPDPLKKDSFPEAQEAFGQALRYQPDDRVSIRGLAVITLELGLNESAEDLFSRLLEIVPDDAEILYLRGLARYKASLFSLAVIDLDKAISLDNFAAEYYYLRSLVNDELALSDSSQEDLETSCALSSTLEEDLVHLITDRSCPT